MFKLMKKGLTKIFYRWKVMKNYLVEREGIERKERGKVTRMGTDVVVVLVHWLPQHHLPPPQLEPVRHEHSKVH